jgi:hypothetical protein
VSAQHQGRRGLAIETLFLDAGCALVVQSWQRISVALAARGVRVAPAALAAALAAAERDRGADLHGASAATAPGLQR